MSDWLDILHDIRRRNIAQPEPSSEAVFTNASYEDVSCASCDDSGPLEEAEYDGRTITLNEPFRTPDGPKKFAVYVKNENGNVIKLGFGDPNLSIKRDDPERRKAFLSRHNCDQPGPKWKAKYWSCKWGWGKTPVSDKLK